MAAEDAGEEEVVDLQTTLAQYRKEMGGPFLTKDENRELKEE